MDRIWRWIDGSPTPPLILSLVALALFIVRIADSPQQHGPERLTSASAERGFPSRVCEAIGERSLAGFRLSEARQGDEAVAELVLVRGEERLRVWVVQPGAWPHRPPERSEGYDLFYGPAHGTQEPTEEDALTVLRALAPILDGM